MGWEGESTGLTKAGRWVWGNKGMGMMKGQSFWLDDGFLSFRC